MIDRSRVLALRQLPEFFTRARRWYGRLMTIFYMIGDEGGNQGVVVVPQKVSHKAVDRNRLKRQLKNILNSHLRPSHGLQVVIVVKPAVLGASYQQLVAEMEVGFQQISQ